MPNAARLGDSTMHGGVITTGCASVLIEGLPAARVSDYHLCPMCNPGTPPPPHVGGPILQGSSSVFIGGLAAARVGDKCTCMGPSDSIAQGSRNVIIGDNSNSGSNENVTSLSQQATQEAITAIQSGT